MRKRMKILLLLFFAGNGMLSAQNIRHLIEQPLGMAYDQTFLWLSDPKQKTITAIDLNRQKTLTPKQISIAGMRDLVYYNQYLLTAFEGRLYKINPNNGNVDEQISLGGITQPISIAADNSLLFIYNKADGNIYRFDVEKKMQQGKFNLKAKSLRGMTFHKGFLWALLLEDSQTVRIAKINPDNGEIINNFLTASDAYGLEFINGSMFMASANQINEISYVETDDYVASGKKNVEVELRLVALHLWPKEQVIVDMQKKAGLKALPINTHQRLRQIRATAPLATLRRLGSGDHQLELKYEGDNQPAQHQLKFQASLQSMTFIFNSANIRKYFDDPNSPAELSSYMSVKTEQRKKYQEKYNQIKQQNNGVIHPSLLLAQLKKTGYATEEILIFLRLAGIPARLQSILNINTKNVEIAIEMFVNPVGWVPVTSLYDMGRPNEFSISNDMLQLADLESMYFSPEVLDKELKPVVLRQAPVSIEIISIKVSADKE